MQEGSSVLAIKTKLNTVIGAYLHPESLKEEIIELREGVKKIDRRESVILASDLNCRIDMRARKGSIVLNYIWEEGLRLINDANLKTHVCQNGTSDIDLVSRSYKA